jgi:HK97 family phage portal protein
MAGVGVSTYLAANPAPPTEAPRVPFVLVRRTLAAARASWKAFQMRFATGQPRSWWWASQLGATRREYAAEVGDGRGNAVVMACMRKIVRTFPEAPCTVYFRRDGRGGAPPGNPEWVARPENRLQTVLERPNPYYSGLLLWAGTLADYVLTGNAYWLKVRAAAGTVVELWWVPSTMLEPKWPEQSRGGDGTTFISHYEYRVGGNDYRIPPQDVVHFRDGLDPDNVRKGLSPLASLFREIATDNSAANWTASLLRNLGVPGVVLSPGDDAEFTQENADLIKASFSSRFGGDRVGEPLVMAAKTQVSVLAFNPQQMVLRELRQITEERISAVFGTPAIVVGLGAGLARSTYSNMAEAREDLYESLLVPMQRSLAADVNSQLVPDFGDPSRLKVAFDLTQVRVLQEDQNALHERMRADLLAGMVTLNEARAAIGLDPMPEPDGDVVYVPATITATAPADLLALPMEEPEPLPALPPPGDDEEDDDEAMQRRARARRNGHVKTVELAR